MARAASLTADIENVPEADRLEGFPHPRETRSLFGHQSADRMMAQALVSGRMHHAWLVVGLEGIGKATFCYRFARAALARPEERDLFGDSLEVAPETSAYRQVTARSHPGLIVIRRAYDQKAKRSASNVSVDDVRRLRSFLSLSAEEGGWRVVIVDSADDMNLNAANALLKSLEEPPPQTVFLIVSSSPGRLLPTIRSRCRLLTLEPLNKTDLVKAVRQALEAAGKPLPSEAELEGLQALSGGSVRRMLSMMGAGGVQLQARIDKLLSSLPQLDLKAAHALADELQPAAQEQKFELFFDLLFATLARLTRAAATQQGTAPDLAMAARLIGPGRVAAFAQLWETLARDKSEADALNLDRKALILDALAKIEAAAHS